MKKLVIPNLTLFSEDGTSAPNGEEGGLTPELESALDAIAPNPRRSISKQPVNESGKQQPKAAETKIEQAKDDTLEEDQKPSVQKTEDKDGEFEKLIKGEYKSEFDKRVQSVIDRRFKDEIARYKNNEKASAPILDKLYMRYGIKSGDFSALAAAVDKDNSYLEQQADELGVDVSLLTKTRQAEHQMAILKQEQMNLERQRQEMAARRAFDEQMSGFYSQAEEAKAVYPDLDFAQEAKNPDFMELCLKGVPVRTAYEVIHKDEILGMAMQVSAQKAVKNTVDNIKAKGMRPDENGTTGSGVVIKNSVSDLNNQEIDELLRRIERGEKVTL